MNVKGLYTIIFYAKKQHNIFRVKIINLIIETAELWINRKLQWKRLKNMKSQTIKRWNAYLCLDFQIHWNRVGWIFTRAKSTYSGMNEVGFVNYLCAHFDMVAIHLIH